MKTCLLPPLRSLLTAALLLAGPVRANTSQPSPLPGQQFPGVSNAETAGDGSVDGNNRADGGAPPDTTGAVGPDHVMTATNFTMRIHDRVGGHISTVNYPTWMAQARGDTTTRFYFDPRVAYDAQMGRWIFYSSSFTGGSNSRADGMMHLAVSTTSDPTGEWTVWDVSVDQVSPDVWFDQPRLGFGSGMVAVTVTTLARPTAGTGWYGVSVFVLSGIAPASGGGLEATSTLFSPFDDDGLTWQNGLVCPAACYGGSNGVLPMLAVLDYETSLYGVSYLLENGGKVYLLPELLQTSAPEFPCIIPKSNNNGHAPQSGSSVQLEHNAGRIESLCYRVDHDRMWAVETAAIAGPSGADYDYCIAQWMEMSLNGEIQQMGRLGGASGAVLTPSIAVNSARTMLLGYTTTSPSISPSPAYAIRFASDTAGCTKAGIRYKSGASTYTRSWDGRCRWGDYSTTVVDPVNDTGLWTCQEWSPTDLPAVLAGDRYGCEWARALGPADPPVITAQPPASVTANVGGNASMSVTASGSSLSYQWYYDSQLLAGATSPTLTVTQVTGAKLGKYRCRVSNSGGSVYSNWCAIIFAVPPGGIINLEHNAVYNSSLLLQVQEGQPAQVRLVRSGGSQGKVSVKVVPQKAVPSAAVFGKAAADVDYSMTATTVTFNSGETLKTITVPTMEDTGDEGREAAQLLLLFASEADALSGTQLNQGAFHTPFYLEVVDNDEPLPMATATDYGTAADWAYAADAWTPTTGTTAAHSTFAAVQNVSPGTPLTLDGPTVTGPGTLMFEWGCVTGGGGNYLAVKQGSTQLGSITGKKDWAVAGFAISSGVQNITWDFLGYSAADSGWVDWVHFYPGNAGVANWESTAISTSEGETVTLKIVRSGLTSASTITVRTSDSTTTAGADYTALDTSVSFAAGQTTATVDIPISTDAVAENEETLIVRLFEDSSTRIAAGRSSTARIKIRDGSKGSYDAWASGYFTTSERQGSGPGTRLADPDGDGGKNLIEFATGTDPKFKTKGPALNTTSKWTQPITGPALRTSSGSFSFTRNTAARGIRIIVQTSTSLGTWVDGPSYGDNPANDVTTTTLAYQTARSVDTRTGLEVITIADRNSRGGPLLKNYFRLKVVTQ